MINDCVFCNIIDQRNEEIVFDKKLFKENQYLIVPKNFNVLHIIG